MEPVACTLPTGALADRMNAYRALLAESLVAGERTADGMRWTLRAGPGVEARARELADRERACCGFLTITVTAVDGLVVWEATTYDDPAAQGVLEALAGLPATAPPS